MSASDQISKQRRSGALGYLRVVLGLALLIGVIYLVKWGELLAALREVSLLDIGVLALISVLLVWVSVVKWRLFLRRLGISTGTWRLSGLYLVGYFVNIFTPSFIGGDVVRSMALGGGVDRARAVSATFLERYSGIVAMLAMALVASLSSSLVTPQIRIFTVAAALGCAVGTWFLLSPALGRCLKLLPLPQRVSQIMDRIQQGLRWGVADRSLLARALLLSVVFHLLTVVNTAAVGWAVGWRDIPWQGLMVVVPLILLVGALPVSPQGLGIQEGAFVFFLSAIGATASQALAIALVLRAKSYILALCGGVVWFFLRSGEEKISSKSGLGR
ncbi:MAG: YbhN family protein [Pseudomonadota bacterium]